MPDAVVVGAGPNGLAAAITLARAGLTVTVLEASSTPGGGTRSAELTLPGFVHDVCSSVMATTGLSPFFQGFDLERRGVRFVHPQAPIGHALEGGRAAVLERSMADTADNLGTDGTRYRLLMGPLVRDVDRLMGWLLGPPFRLTRHPIAQARFGIPALLPATVLARAWFSEEPARALMAGLAAHSMISLRSLASASFGLVLGLVGHAWGWPVVRGGTGRLTDALVAELAELGGSVQAGVRVSRLDELPPARAIMLDVSPRHAASICGERLLGRYRRSLERYRYGPGVCKVDWALSAPIPWTSPQLARAGTVHLGGSIDEVARSEQDVQRGRIAPRPFVILVQASLFDPSRAPEGRHTAWAYCHVPGGSPVDMTERIEAQVERFAPGFRDVIIGRATRTAPEYEAYDANFVGGDVNVGIQDLRQILGRPVIARDPYAMPARGLYLCSSATPPGGGVHGMCGYLAARSALRREFGIRV